MLKLKQFIYTILFYKWESIHHEIYNIYCLLFAVPRLFPSYHFSVGWPTPSCKIQPMPIRITFIEILGKLQRSIASRTKYWTVPDETVIATPTKKKTSFPHQITIAHSRSKSECKTKEGWEKSEFYQPRESNDNGQERTTKIYRSVNEHLMNYYVCLPSQWFLWEYFSTFVLAIIIYKRSRKDICIRSTIDFSCVTHTYH